MWACQRLALKRKEFDCLGQPLGGGHVGADFEEFDEGSQNRGCVGFGVPMILLVLPPHAHPHKKFSEAT